jgi:hypothetical protein
MSNYKIFSSSTSFADSSLPPCSRTLAVPRSRRDRRRIRVHVLLPLPADGSLPMHHENDEIPGRYQLIRCSATSSRYQDSKQLQPIAFHSSTEVMLSSKPVSFSCRCPELTFLLVHTFIFTQILTILSTVESGFLFPPATT